MKRCQWCNENNPLYVNYHDFEWGLLRKDNCYLLEMLILESFQAGLSWECILNKRNSFKKAYDNFDINKIIKYEDDKVDELMNNSGIVRNKLKIKASIKNAIIFKNIISEYGSFYDYLTTFTRGKTYYELGKDHNELSDVISKDLSKRGMTFVGTKIIYSFLQAIGVIYSHEKDCFLYKSRMM